MARRWVAGAVAALATVPLVLGGCSSAPQASTTLPSTSRTTSTTSSLPPLGPADFPMPASARQKTADGFNEFTKYYIELINRLGNDLDSRFLRQLSQSCATCERIASDADSDATKGYRYRGGTITVTAIAPAHVTESTGETAFTTDQAAYTVVDADGDSVPGLSADALTKVAGGSQGLWEGDHWVLTNLSFG